MRDEQHLSHIVAHRSGGILSSPMESREIVASVKKATVALALMTSDESTSQTAPFQIVGSGFCVHPAGIIVTCRHVIQAFIEESIDAQVNRALPLDGPKSVKRIPGVRVRQPFAIFLQPETGGSLILAYCVGLRNILVQADSNMDLGAASLSPHEAFPKGYPSLSIEDFENVHDGLDIATYGFPRGIALLHELGKVGGSLSRGVVSAILPSSDIGRNHVRGFQLDLRATHGNSGGPVFSWASGRVLGVLASGINDDYGHHLFSNAESIYRLVDGGLVEQLLNPPPHLIAARDSVV